MYFSIKNRILIPLIAIQSIATIASAIATANLAARRGEREVVDRLDRMADALGTANFPHTADVLSKMRGLSGAHFVAYATDGRAIDSSLPGAGDLPASLRSAPAASAAWQGSLGDSPRAVVAGVSYLSLPLRSSTSPSGSSLLVLYPETSWRQGRWEAAMPPLMLGALSLGGMAVVTGWIAHRVGLRIRRVERQVARIAEGDFRPVEPGRGRDEVHDLSRSINRMSVQLLDLRGTVERSERTRLLAQFAAGLAHQIRNSLTGARLSVQLHARRHPSPDGNRGLDVALRQLALTEEQVKGLLSLGRVEPRPSERCDLRRLIAEVALLVEPSCQHARVAFREPPPGPPVEVFADASGLRSATLNLALNAIEAAGPGGRVALAIRDEPGRATIEVVDTGPGPPPEIGESLWDPFVTGKPEGVGLGLAIARQVAIEHGGRLDWSRAGGATRFALTLPTAERGHPV